MHFLGEVTAEEAEIALEENDQSADTNFTSGAHFIEQVRNCCQYLQA